MVFLASLVRIRLREDYCRFLRTLFNHCRFLQDFFRIIVDSYGSLSDSSRLVEDQYQTLVDLFKLAKGGLYITIGFLVDFHGIPAVFS